MAKTDTIKIKATDRDVTITNCQPETVKKIREQADKEGNVKISISSPQSIEVLRPDGTTDFTVWAGNKEKT